MKSFPSITIGITTYNRKDILEKMAKSFYESDLAKAQINIRIYDDNSTEFDENYLKSLFPNLKTLIRNKTNLKADLNIYSMYCDFLKSDDDYFFNADSDLIFNKNWLNYIFDNFDATDGILSIFNTKNHVAIDKIESKHFLLKKDIGSAGTFFSRERVEQLVSFIEVGDKLSIDWQFCQKFIERGIKIYCSEKSYVQHIGIIGQNTFWGVATDFGENFEIDSLTNGQILNDLLLDLTTTQSKKNAELIEEKINLKSEKRISDIKNTKDYKLGNFLLKPLRVIKKIIKKN